MGAILPDMDAADGGVLYHPEEAAAQVDGRNKVMCRYGLMLPRPSLLKGPEWPLDLNSPQLVADYFISDRDLPRVY